MQDYVLTRLLGYISKYYPDVLLEIEMEGKSGVDFHEILEHLLPVSHWLTREEQRAYAQEEVCMEELVRGLGPSRFLYIRNLFEQEFEQEYVANQDLLHEYELLNLIQVCGEIFDQFEFNENTEDNQLLRYAVIGGISDYLQENKRDLTDQADGI